MIEGAVIRPGGTIFNQPYVKDSESIAGYIVVHAQNMNDAIRIAEKCPILNGSDKSSIEVRETATRQISKRLHVVKAN